MTCKTENTNIDGVDYVTTQFPAVMGMEFKMEVLKVLGPAITEVLPAFLKRGEGEADQVAMLGHAIEKMFSIAQPKDVVGLIVRILTTGHTFRDGKPLNEAEFNRVFAGDDMMSAYKVFAFVLRTNYANFLSSQKLGGLLASVERPSTEGGTQT